jgi:catechol 2,3-dioxygenase
MMINATLRRLVISSPQPEPVANFYGRAFDYQVSRAGEDFRCEGQNRSLWIRIGAPNELLESHFVFSDPDCFRRYVADLSGRGVSYSGGLHLGEVDIVDPDGHRVIFSTADTMKHNVVDCMPRDARLQHYAVRTPEPSELVDFYARVLSFTVSDLVHDGSGDLTAAFLRTDVEHHALAIFRAPARRFDHLSCETRDWNSLRDWADWLAARSVRLVWGVGRHGPGNDAFFMVLDPDGNLAEISCELEVCTEDRVIGHWDHRMETLNQWGVAILRS